MRIIVVALLLGLGLAAHADGFASFELAAGGHVPLGDATWTHASSPSPGVFGAVGWHLDEHFGVLGSGAAIDQYGLVGPSGTYKPTMWRLRFLAHAFYEAEVVPHLTVVARMGIGLDEMLLNWDQPSGGNASFRSEQTSSLALEPGAGVWWDAGIGLQIGGELAIPISTARTSKLIGAQYIESMGPPFATYDLAVLAGIRITSKRD